MQTDAIDYNKPSNQEYLTAYNEANDASETGLYFKIELSVRGCIEGESLESTGMYIEYWLIVIQMRGVWWRVLQFNSNGWHWRLHRMPGWCVVLLHRSNHWPQTQLLEIQHHFWAIHSLSIHSCLSVYLSLPIFPLIIIRGMLAVDQNQLGECEEGYQKILCADCAPGYSRTGNSIQTIFYYSNRRFWMLRVSWYLCKFTQINCYICSRCYFSYLAC